MRQGHGFCDQSNLEKIGVSVPEGGRRFQARTYKQEEPKKEELLSYREGGEPTSFRLGGSIDKETAIEMVLRSKK